MSLDLLVGPREEHGRQIVSFRLQLVVKSEFLVSFSLHTGTEHSHILH